MHNLYANFVKFLEVYKSFSTNHLHAFYQCHEKSRIIILTVLQPIQHHKQLRKVTCRFLHQNLQ